MKEFKYKAFISHRMVGEGQEAAERLVSFLRRFRTPEEILKAHPGCPARFDNIFYSKDSGVPNALYTEMPGKLADAEYLIVVCTKDYAKPNKHGKCYADIAAASFLGYPVSEKEPHGIPKEEFDNKAEKADDNRRRHIIPVIFRNPDEVPTAEECLPPFILRLGLIAPDTGKAPEEEVFFDFTAKLLGVDKNELRDRWKEEEKRREEEEARRRAEERHNRLMKIIGFSLFFSFIALLCTIGGVWAYSYLLPHYSYYTDYVERNNIPHGLNPVNKEQRKHLHSHYRITEQFHRITRIDCLNSADRPCRPQDYHGWEDRPVSYCLEYDADHKKVTKHLCYDEHGKLIQERHFEGKDVLYYTPRSAQEEGESKTVVIGSAAFSLGVNDTLSKYRQRNKNIQRKHRQLSREGYVEWEYFCDFNGDRTVQNNNGVSGCRYGRDKQGRIISCTYLDGNFHDGKKTKADKNGVLRILYMYANGVPTSTSYQGKDEKPILNEWGWATEVYEYQHGNICCIRFNGIDGEPSIKKGGFAAIKFTLTTDGYITKYEYLDTKGNLCRNEAGCAIEQREPDKNGNVISERYFDIDGEPCPDNDGIAGWTATYDEATGYMLSRRYLGINDVPCFNADGIAEWKFTYDRESHRVSAHFFGVNGEPCLKKDGIAGWVVSFDEENRPLSVRYLDRDDRPCLDINGIAGWTATFDEVKNCVLSLRYTGFDDKPCLDRSGTAGWTATYDEVTGNMLSQHYLGIDDEPCLDSNGIAGWIATYDKTKGYMLSQHYLGLDDEPCLNRSGTAGWAATYDEVTGNILSRRLLGLNEEPCACLYGHAEILYQYDSYNRLISEQYLDTEGIPIRTIETSYEADGRASSVTRFHDEEQEEETSDAPPPIENPNELQWEDTDANSEE